MSALEGLSRDGAREQAREELSRPEYAQAEPALQHAVVAARAPHSALGIDGPLLPATPGAAVAIVLATRDYPAAPRTGDRISGLATAAAAGALVHCRGAAPLGRRLGG